MPHPPHPRWVATTNAALDRAARAAQRIRIAGRRLRPYRLASDVAVVASLAAAFEFARQFGGIVVWRFVAVFAAMRLLHRVIVVAKARWLGTAARSLLQDTLVLLPAYAVGSVVAGQPLPHAFDVAALVLAVHFSIVRLGCFGAGCCYGRPSRLGVLYGAATFASQPASCRSRGAPAVDPGTRVLPVQLAESAIHASAAAAIWFGLGRFGVDGLMLPRYLAVYGATRFALDFVRPRSSRPRVGRWSEAQLVALAVVGLALAVLVLAGGGAR